MNAGKLRSGVSLAFSDGGACPFGYAMHRPPFNDRSTELYEQIQQRHGCIVNRTLTT